MKKAISLILTVLMIVSSFSVMSLVSAKETNIVSSGNAYSGTTGDCTWNFDEDTGTLTISGEGRMDDYIYFQSTPWYSYHEKIKAIVIENGVTNIGDYSFNYEYKICNLSNIIISNSVVSIGEGAFQYCTGLTDIILPNSVKYIGKESFRECTSLVSIVIPNSVNTIGSYAFLGCTSLTSINIPKSVNEIGITAFNGCINLSDISVDNENQFYTSINGDLYSKDKTRIIQYAIGKETDSFIIPKGVVSICEGAFSSCDNLTSILIPSSVTSIEMYAFSSCNNLTSILIPDSVTSIELYAFSSCGSLTNICVDEDNKYYSSIDGNLYSKDETYFDLYAPGKKTGSFIIPDSVTSINTSAFSVCTSLTNITIPVSVTFVGYNAFSYCKNLKDVYFKGTKEQWDKIIINPYNDYLLNANIHYSGVPTPTKPTVNKITKVALNKKSVTLNKGKSTTVKATVTPANATNKKLKWTTSNSKVATVSQSGKVIAKSRGIAIIKAMSTDGSNKYANLKVTVKQPVTSVKLNRNSVNLKVKGNAKQKTVTLKAKVYPNNVNNKTVKWSTSKSKIAIVNSKGKVTAKKKGTCYIIATAKDGSKKYAKCKITVK